MKTTVRVMTAAMIAMSMQAAAARKGGSVKTVDTPKVADTVVVYKTDTIYINDVTDGDGNVIELAQITNQWQLEAYKAKLLEESKRNRDETNLESRRRQIEDESYENRLHFNLISSYFSLFMFGLGLPILMLFLYLHYSKSRQQRYETLIDLIRSGVEVKPEMIDALSLNRMKINWCVLAPQKRNGMVAEHYIYCMKRVAWAVFCVAMGLILSITFERGTMFGLGLATALVLLMQAAIRYFGMSYFMKNTDVEATGHIVTTYENTRENNAANATSGVNNNNTSTTPDNNAQQP